MNTTGEVYKQVADRSRRDSLILANLSLVRHALGRLVSELPPGVDVENLEAAGTLGLVEAATTFDPTRGIEFRRFAYLRVRGAMLDELRRNCPLPQEVVQRVSLVRKAYSRLTPPVSTEDLVKATGLSEDEVLDTLSAVRMTRMVSCDDPTTTLLLRLDDPHDRPDVILERSELKTVLADAIESLPERERIVVTLYFLEDLRLKEIGRAVGLSESRVSRLLSGALFQLNEYLGARGLR